MSGDSFGSESSSSAREQDAVKRRPLNGRGPDDRRAEPLVVLWIEDDPEAAPGLLRGLTDGCHLEIARYGMSGLELARRRTYDVIILDWKLPRLTGPEVLERLQLARVRTPVVALSGYVDEELHFEAGRFGACAVRSKSIPVTGLLNR